MIKWTAPVLAAMMAFPANAAVIDTFDRPDAPTLGPAYTVHAGGFAISGNRAIARSNAELATLNGVTSAAAGIDIALRGADAGSYVGLSFGFESPLSYFIKVQDNNGDGVFDSYGFYTDNNSAGEARLRDLTSGFLSGTMNVSFSGTIATLMLTSGGIDQTYTYDYGFVPGSDAVGFGLNRQGVADNFRVEPLAAGVPEPRTWALMILGMGMVGAAARKRRAMNVTRGLRA